MFRFEDPIYLWLLVLIPILALIRFISYHDQKILTRNGCVSSQT